MRCREARWVMVTLFAAFALIAVPSVYAQESDQQGDQHSQQVQPVAGLQKAEPEIVFYGKVVDLQDEPISGVTITVDVQTTISTRQRAPRIVRVVTDQNGLFTISNQSYHISHLSGTMLEVRDVKLSGYAWKPDETGDRIQFLYTSLHQAPYVPAQGAPALFHLRKRGPTTFLLRDERGLSIPSDGASIFSGTFSDAWDITPASDDMNRLPGFTVSARHEKGNSNELVLTFKGKHDGDTLMLLDHIVYEAPPLPASYRTNVSVTVNQTVDRKKTVRNKKLCLILCTAKPRTFSRIELEVGVFRMPGDNTCSVFYTMWLNPYGERTFELADQAHDLPAIAPLLTRQAVHALCNGTLPPMPDMAQIVADIEKTGGKSLGIGHSRESDDAMARMFKAHSGESPLISFYGKVVDLDDQPLPDVAIAATIPQSITIQINGQVGYGSINRIATVYSDSEGRFEITGKTYNLPHLTGRFLSLDIHKNGYETHWEGSRKPTAFDYPSKAITAASPEHPTVFHLRKMGVPSFLLKEQPNLALSTYVGIHLAPDNAPVGEVFSVTSNLEDGLDRKLCPGIQASAKVAPDTSEWTVTIRGKGDNDKIARLDKIVYEAPSDERAYQSALTVSIAPQKSAKTDQSPKYPIIVVPLVLRSAAQGVYSRVELRIQPFNAKRCDVYGTAIINPYGDRTFEYAKELDQYSVVVQQLWLQAVKQLCAGKPADKPDLTKLIHQAANKKQ